MEIVSEKNLSYEQRGYLNSDFKLFHLDDDKQIDIPWHYHDFDKIVFFINGQIDYYVEGRQYTLKNYDIVAVPHNSIHKLYADGKKNYERYILYIKPSVFDKYEKALGRQVQGLKKCFDMVSEKKTYLIHFDGIITSKLLNDLKKLEEDIKDAQNDTFGDVRTNLDVITLLADFNDYLDKNPIAFMEKARYNRKVIDIIDYISENLQKDLSIDRIADKFYISKYHMMRMFKAETGYSIHQYIMEKRILKAKDLIVSGTSAMTASIEVGFNDYSSFCKAFQKQIGKLPSEYSEKK